MASQHERLLPRSASVPKTDENSGCTQKPSVPRNPENMTITIRPTPAKAFARSLLDNVDSARA